MHAITQTVNVSADVTMKKPRLARLFARSPMVVAAGLSILFSLVLFMLLYSAIHVGKFVADQSAALQTIDFVRLRRDSDVETLSRRKPPPPPAQPPPPAKMKVVADSVQQG